MEINESKVSIIKKYPTETLVLILCFAISFLTGWIYKTDNKVDSLQVEMKTYLNSDRKILIETLDKNTQAWNEVKILCTNNQNQK